MQKKDQQEFIENCNKLLIAYREGLLGNVTMPEDTHPDFSQISGEMRLRYFTFPMSINYQRDSYKLWEAASKTYLDQETSKVFDLEEIVQIGESNLRGLLTKHKLALQPNRHVNTWYRIVNTIYDNWGSVENMLAEVDYDFLVLKTLIQVKYKKGFPYLSGPKIFNYWSYIIQRYGRVNLKNSKYIEIAPDTHVIQSSIKLGLIDEERVNSLSRDEISQIWRDILSDTDIDPIQMHSPLWFWSRNKFKYKLQEDE